jgi:hypothetical protein
VLLVFIEEPLPCLVVLLLLILLRAFYSNPPSEPSPPRREYLWAVGILSIAFAVISGVTAVGPFEAFPHSQDEVADLAQARIFKSGALYLDSLPLNLRGFFDEQFMVNDGKWFSIYPPGHPFLLMLGLFVKAPHLVNAFFGAATIPLLYLFVADLLGAPVAFGSTLLWATSLFTLIQAASMMSHVTCGFFILLALTCAQEGRWKTAAAAWGLGFLIRTFVGVLALPVLGLLYFRNRQNRRTLIFSAGIAGLFVTAYLGYNGATTGSIFLPGYQYYSPSARIGFGPRGVEWPLDFTPWDAVENVLQNLYALKKSSEFFAFALSSGLLVLAWTIERRRASLILTACVLLPVAGYFFYFHAGAFLGPRYWFEFYFALAGLTALALWQLLACFPLGSRRLPAYLLMIGVLCAYYGWHAWKDLPSFRGYNQMTRSALPPSPPPNSLVFVPGSGSRPNRPPLSGADLARHFPDRQIYFWAHGTLWRVRFNSPSEAH